VDKTKTKQEIKVTVTIIPSPLTPAQQQQWDRVWRRLIAETKQSEAESDNHVS
jgi:hypothetical protein